MRSETPKIRLSDGKEYNHYTREYVVKRLEDAGRSLMRSPDTTKPRGYKSNWPDIVQSAQEAYGYTSVKMKWGGPTAEQITRMDEVLDWMFLIENIAHRSAVMARSLNHPITMRPMYSWRKLSKEASMSHMGVKRHYNKGLEQLIHKLNTGSKK